MNDNPILEKFRNWMKTHRNLSPATIEKYTRSINSISNDMIKINLIDKKLTDMSLVELDLAIALILRNEEFTSKNKKGNHMYSNGLKQYRYFVLDCIEGTDEKEIEIVKSIEADTTIEMTEKLAIVKSRIGQGEFRKQLINKYSGKCVVTGIDLTKILVASHIKPWSVSDNFERISSENGLLLSANYDKLFDSGLITFKNDGTIVASSFINQKNKIILGLQEERKVDLKSTSEMLINLEYHRDILFVS